MKKKWIALAVVFILILLTVGCGEDPELTEFKINFENFCTNISTLDAAINQIDAESEDAAEELLGYIDQLDQQFRSLAYLEFPEKFQYLEELPKQAAQYMSEAAASYHKAYADGSFDKAMNDYAYENYKRAYKRIRILLIYLQGGKPGEGDLADETPQETS